MARNNPSNPYTRDPGHTAKDVAMPVQKAKVMSSDGHPDNSGFHTVTIRIYGDDAPYVAPVITPMFGSVWVPKEGQDVAVIFSEGDKPWVVGAWYPVDRVENGEVDLPDYVPGDIRLGNDSGSHVTVHDNGSISVKSERYQKVDIDHNSASVRMSTDQVIPGDDTYYRVDFDTIDYDPEELFDASTNSITLRHGGQYRIDATIEVELAGQGKRYTLAMFKNGVVVKHKSVQSSVNASLSANVSTQRRFDDGDVIDIRLKQDSGANKTINSDYRVSEFSLQRHGI